MIWQPQVHFILSKPPAVFHIIINETMVTGEGRNESCRNDYYHSPGRAEHESSPLLSRVRNCTDSASAFLLYPFPNDKFFTLPK